MYRSSTTMTFKLGHSYNLVACPSSAFSPNSFTIFKVDLVSKSSSDIATSSSRASRSWRHFDSCSNWILNENDARSSFLCHLRVSGPMNASNGGWHGSGCSSCVTAHIVVVPPELGQVAAWAASGGCGQACEQSSCSCSDPKFVNGCTRSAWNRNS